MGVRYSGRRDNPSATYVVIPKERIESGLSVVRFRTINYLQ